jgi:hypothetical protein
LARDLKWPPKESQLLFALTGNLVPASLKEERAARRGAIKIAVCGITVVRRRHRRRFSQKITELLDFRN